MVDDRSYLMVNQKHSENQNTWLRLLSKIFLRPFKYLVRIQTPDELIQIFIDFASVILILMDLFLIPLNLSFKEVQTN